MSRKAGSKRGYIGASFKSAVDFIQQRGLAKQVLADCAPETARLVEKPPVILSWMDSKPLDELETLIAKHAGRQACVDLGLEAARKLGGTMVQPVLRLAMTLFGQTPATLLANLDRFYPLVTSGMHFEYEPASDTEGVVAMTCDGPGVPPAVFDVTRGNLMYMIELCQRQGTVDAPELVSSDPTATVVRYRARWS
jgi:hypothetical protein